MSESSIAVATLLMAVVAAPVRAELVDAESNGFTIRHETSIRAARAIVYNAAVHHVGAWWSDAHTVSGDASNMRIDPQTQGCFCESLGDGGGVVHMTVTFVNPEVMIRFTGGLGPLGLMGVNGNMTWELETDGDLTHVTLNYAVGGFLPGGLDAIAPSVDAVLVEQMQRLKAFVETDSVAE